MAVLAILGFVLFQRHNTKYKQVAKAEKTEQVANSKSSSSEKAKEDDETQLKKGSNHSIEESDYAYDVTAVNNTIRGKSDDVKGKVVFLTFDDGIDPTLTPQVMNILKENGDILKRQITEGHAIANHSLSHNFNLLYPGRVPNQSQIISEVDQTMANFKAILGKDFKTRIFRYPGSHMDGSQKYFPETTVKVVLMHDTAGKELTVQTLPQIIEYFKNQGYTFGVLE